MIDWQRIDFLIKRLPEMQFKVDKAFNRVARLSKPMSDMPRSHNPSTMDDGVILYTEAKEALKAFKDELDGYTQCLNELIPQIEDEKVRRAMYERYIEHRSINRISHRMLYDRSYIYTMI